MMIFFYLLLGFYALCCSYLLLITIASCFFRKRHGEHFALPSISVVIPAHNEEGEIASAVASALSADYPQEKVQVIVLADNCTDATAQKAREAGAIVWERFNDTDRGKGYALHEFFTTQQTTYQNAELLVLIDADTQMDSRFLQEIALSFSADGIQVLQGYYTVSNPGDNWLTALATAALSIVHDMRPAGRETLGGTAGLKGNGMAFRRELLQRYGWPCHSIVEDLEFSLFLMENGIRIHYNPDAIVYGEMPASKRQAAPQRQRWDEGRFRIAGTMSTKLIKQFLLRLQFRYLDALIDLIVPPLSLLAALGGLLLGWSFFLSPEYSMLTLLFTAGLVIYVITGIARQQPPKYVWLALFAAPVFVLFKLGIYARMLILKKKPAWVRTQRNKEAAKD